MLINSFANLNHVNNLRHAVFTRMEGVSEPPFNSLNLSVASGDNAANVNTNLNAVRAYFHTPHIANIKQIHSDIVVTINAGNRESLNTPAPVLEGDALVTALTNTVLLVKVADCQPVLLADPVKKIIAAAHSGWRGSVQNIIGKTVLVMQTKFGCNPADIIAAIGPSLGPCCAEFTNYKTELPPSFWPFKLNACHFNFWRISAMQMKAAGILEKNIEISGLCTVCNTDLFYSYRRDKITGRFGAAIMLTESC